MSIAKHAFAAITLLMAVLSGAVRVRADTSTWLGSVGGNWNDDGNWVDGDPNSDANQPFEGDLAVIPTGIPFVNSLEFIGSLEVGDNAGIEIGQGTLSVSSGNAANDGTIEIGATMVTSQLILGQGVLGGDGEVVLGNSDFSSGGAFLNGLISGVTGETTHAATHTIRGEGAVNNRWINNGLIRAEDVTGDLVGTLRIGGTMTNNGVIRSSPMGMVDLRAALNMGATGEFIADTQNIIFSSGGSVTGGEVDAINGAKFVFAGGGFTTLSDVTINGDFDAILPNPGGTVTIGGAGITNNGAMTLDNTGTSEVRLAMGNGTTLGGTGDIVLSREGADRATIRGESFTNGASHTIRGVGAFRATTVASTMVNNGEVLAQPLNGGTVLRVSGTNISNNNLLQADSGATLRFQGDTFATGSVVQSATGRIRAADGGTVELMSNVPITGGKLQTDGTGVILGSGTILNNVINEGEFHVANDTTTRIAGGALTNNGMISVNPTGVAAFPPTLLTFESNSTLDGTGTVLLNSTDAEITTVGNDKVVTQSADHTIRGKGLIRFGTIANHGRLEGLSAAEPLRIGGAVSGDGVLKDVYFNAGWHVVGDVGTTAIVPLEGSYKIDGTGFISVGRLFMDLAGTTPGTGHDQLNSTGPITIGSQTHLNVSFAGGFTPDVGDSFTLLTTTGSLTGNFVATSLPTLPLGLSWQQSQTSTALSISLTGDLAADFDDDGDVDGDDLGIWQAGYSLVATATHGDGDANGDGDVDGRDFLVWQRSYGWGIQPPVDIAAVPEPSVMILLVAAVMGCWSFPRSARMRPPFLRQAGRSG